MIKRKLVDCGILMQDHDLERVLEFYRSVFTQKIQLRKFIEDVDPGAYDHIFPTHKIVSAADLQKVKKEKALASSETDGEVRNLFRTALLKRASHDGVENLIAELRKKDSQRSGRITRSDFNALLHQLGLKVGTPKNLKRLWNAIAGPTETDIDVFLIPLADFYSIHLSLPGDCPHFLSTPCRS
mmetsp:Transcript_24848/g.39003  ORF Transcript_24848/g.39003 Transcript_24848/m.39003 type:complete len:184 (-) Transcript_24848:1110-1661(-)